MKTNNFIKETWECNGASPRYFSEEKYLGLFNDIICCIFLKCYKILMKNTMLWTRCFSYIWFISISRVLYSSRS